MTKDFRQMNSSFADLETLNGLTRALERSECRRTGRKLLPAREDIARRLGITPDTIENFRSLRTKIVPHWLLNKVRAELVSVLEMERQNLEHEIQLYKQTGAHHTDVDLCAAETQLSAVREVLGRE